MANGNFIAYYRVSTDKQGQSGLGLEAQQNAVRTYLNGGDWELTHEFTEVESGKNNDRPQLTQALKLCRLTNATLIVAKLDRLSRNAAFLVNLQASKVPFLCVDNPHANPLTIHILAAVAEDERKRISERTKAALQAAKARGVKLGNPNVASISPCDNTAANAARAAKAQAFRSDLAEIIESIQQSGITTLKGIASELNKRGIPAARGGNWSPMQVSRAMR